MPSVAARQPVAWVALVVVAGVALLGPEREADRGPGAAMAALVAAEAAPRTLDPYEGLGAWIDVFDYAPAYQGGGAAPPLDVRVVDDMAAAGVRTLFLQAARADERSPEGIVDPALVSRLLVRSHQAGLRVVAWYLPTFDDVERDVRRVEQLLALEVLGHRFDGVALDIELTEAVPDHAERNRRLVELSTRVRATAGDATLGAIVLPPVQLEVVNPALWPEFPWGELAPLYDVWLPMSYWTFRSDDSGYGDGYAYNDESTRRLRERVDDRRHPSTASAASATRRRRRSWTRSCARWWTPTRSGDRSTTGTPSTSRRERCWRTDWARAYRPTDGRRLLGCAHRPPAALTTARPDGGSPG